MDVCLEADSIIKSFGGRLILSDIYLRCIPGDIIAIWGRNGSGKTTLFRILYGTLKAERSYIQINGQLITGKAYKTGQIACLPQVNYLPKEMIVRDVIQLVCGNKYRGLGDKQIQKIYDIRIRNLSGGELRYLEILLLLESDAPFILLDEPFNKLSPIMVEQVIEYIRLNRQRKGIILSDHNYQAIKKVANKHMLLKEGYLKSMDDVEELENIYLRKSRNL